jgi:hypothetical protein
MKAFRHIEVSGQDCHTRLLAKVADMFRLGFHPMRGG